MKDYDTMEMICGRAESALREVAREADFTKPGDMGLIKDIVSTMYKAECLLDGDDEGYSRDGMWHADGDYTRSNYDTGSSYRGRRRDAMGRYSRRGYSRDSMMEHLDAMMQEADTEEKRERIRRFKEQMGQMM